MMPNDYIQEPLSTEVLQAYLHGALSPAQMDRVTELVNQNPLYQDALEGLKYVDDDYPLQDTINDINLRIREQASSNSRKRTMVWLRPLAAAASIIVVLGIAYILYVSISKPDTDAIYAEHYEKYPSGKGAHEGSAGSLSFDSLEPAALSEPANIPPPTLEEEPAPEIEVVADEIEEEELMDEDIQYSMDQEDIAVQSEEPANATPKESVPEDPTVAEYNYAPTTAAGSTDEMTSKAAETDVITFNKSVQDRTVTSAEHQLQVKSTTGITLPQITQANSLYENGKYQEALDLYNQYLASVPDNAKALLYSSLCLMELEDHKEALKRLEKVTAQPESEFTEPASWYRALTLIKLDKIKKAKKALEEIRDGGGQYATQAESTLEQL